MNQDEDYFTKSSVSTAEESVPVIWQKGDVILDLYEVKEVFHSGGMGLVYQVHHRDWNTNLVVKSPRPEYFQTQNDVENFVREADVWINLGLHPHIVSCYYVRTLGGIPRVFAEYLEGGSLQDWIRSQKLYEGGPEKSLERILDIAIQFAWGLDYAHEQSLIHQDVKPSNVMLTTDGLVKITDFGLAKVRGTSRNNSAETGPESILLTVGGMTPAYCSPEQAGGQRLSQRTDIWSWAVSVLEVFSGGLTWRGGQLAGYALQSYLKKGTQNAEIPQMPNSLAALLKQCLENDSKKRPVDMLEVAERLKEIYQETTNNIYPKSYPEAAKSGSDSLNNRAVSLLDLGKKEEAIKLWDEALRLQPNHPESTYNRGLTLWHLGIINDDALLKQMKYVKESNPNDFMVDYLSGQIHLERNDIDSAIIAFRSATVLTGSNHKQVEDLLRFSEARKPSHTSLLSTFEGHTGDVTSLSLSADCQLAVSGSKDKTLRLWDVATGKCLRTFEGHTSYVWSVSLSADGRFALSGSHDKTLKLWDTETDECLHTFEGHTSYVTSVILSADGRFALSGSHDETLRLWDIETGTCLCTIDGLSSVKSVSLSADGRFALWGGTVNTLKGYDIATGKWLPHFWDHTSWVWSVSLSADGRLALSGSDDKTLKLWEVATGECLLTFKGHTWNVRSVSLSADCQLAVSGSDDKTLKLWEVATGKCLHTYEGHNGIDSVTLSANRNFVLFGHSKDILKFQIFPFSYTAPLTICKITEITTAIKNEKAFQESLAKAEEAYNEPQKLDRSER